MRVYISGPITNNPNYKDQFNRAEQKIKARGHKVVNPARFEKIMPEGSSHEEYMQLSLCMLQMCDAIYMLEGWQQSKGATIEYKYAEEHKKNITLGENNDKKKVISNILFN